MAKVYKENADPEFKRKCIYIMSDFADPDMQFISNDDTPTTEGEDLGTKGNMTGSTTVVKEKVNVSPWCETLQQENKTDKDGERHEDWEIIEHAIELLHESYPETCTLVKNNPKDEL